MSNEREFWQLFARTGEPMAYMLYRSSYQERHKSTEENTKCSNTPASTVS